MQDYENKLSKDESAAGLRQRTCCDYRLYSTVVVPANHVPVTRIIRRSVANGL
jgi:hypothetical protein